MSDRERAREIVERLAYDEELDRNGQEALIATALTQARAEGLRQAAEVLKEAHDHMHRLCAIIPGNDEAYRINVELMARLRALASHALPATDVVRHEPAYGDTQAPPADEVEALCNLLEAPVRTGGYSSEDAWELYDELHLKAATLLRRLKAENVRLHERLEDNHAFDMDGNRIEVEPGSVPDGIDARDETIKR